ncbi:MAG: Trm112 family protein [Victivallales bacterium]|nr:Trm112 family protein [Victivallales bacterium]
MKLISKELMDILVCPADKSELREIEETSQLECKKCKRRYPVREGIPVMLLDEAEDCRGTGSSVPDEEKD